MSIPRPWIPLLVVLLGACETALPEPESPGAQAYRTRCGGCHRLYAPGVMTAAMWDVQIDRMQLEMARRGVAPLDATERAVIAAYLHAHATDAARPAASRAGE
jgi:hypothetical protein